MLYYKDPYLKKASFKIIKKEGKKILLEDTILYPGGGGQPPDVGYALCDGKSIKIEHIGDGWHMLSEDIPCEKEVPIEIDWDRRYYLMKSHTAEHIFFRSLQTRCDVNLKKISLDEDESAIIFEGDVGIEDILEAEKHTLNIIEDGREVKTYWLSLNDAEKIKDLRIARDRIKDSQIRIVEVVGYDHSACKGLHVRNTSEIGDFVVTRVRLGTKKEVRFLVSEKAKQWRRTLNEITRKIIWERNLGTDKLQSYIRNIETERDAMRGALIEELKHTSFTEERCGDIDLVHRVFVYGEHKILQRRVMDIVNTKKAIVIYGMKNNNVVCMAFSDGLNWARDLFMDSIKKSGGKGGGRGNFVSGHVENAEKFVMELKKIICDMAIHLHGDENGKTD